MTPKKMLATVAAALAMWLGAATFADAPSGAIFTTVVDGSEVNYNHYAAKTDVYLDGGPGPGAPQEAAGLDDGTYVFQVTDPSGKTLLSTDPARCRMFTVLDGIITGVVPTGAPGAHNTGLDVDHGAVTVQLMPYLDTPNNGGVYKVWVTRVEDYQGDLNAVDPGYKAGSNVHGFNPSDSKTDNFKVKNTPIVEIDTRFYDADTGDILDGLGITWIDTLGASNDKHSYWAPDLDINHEAHVEAVETGTHTIVIEDGDDYTVTRIRLPDGTVVNGAGSVNVKINNLNKPLTVFIDVEVQFN